MSLDQPPISTEHQIARHCLAELLRMHEAAPDVAVATADAFLEATVPAFPESAPLFVGIQRDADWWAEFASDTMLSAMLQSCLRRMVEGRMIMPPNARKRALVAIWNSLGETDRAAFLAFVDPGSAGRE